MTKEEINSWIRSILPSRSHDAHKGTFGHVVVIAGSSGFTGAAKLVSNAAARSGTGLVTALIPSAVAECIASGLVEPMWRPLPSTQEGSIALEAVSSALAFVQDKQAVVLGPGLSQHPETREFVQQFTRECAVPMVIDADGLNNSSRESLAAMKIPPIITPHPGEMARLLGTSVAAVQKEREEVARSFAVEHSAYVVLKGHQTIVAAPDGACFINPTGNPGMASGGTGDVLAGLIGGFLAQGIQPFDAASAGVYLHGLAGDIASMELTQYAMIAGDIIDRLPQAFNQLEGE